MAARGISHQHSINLFLLQ